MIGFGSYNLYDKNTYRVFNCIIQHGPVTKRELQNYTGLSWGSIVNIIEKLLRLRAIKKSSLTRLTSGRTSQCYDINDEDNLCIGVDATLGRVTGVLVSMKGECLYCETYHVNTNQSIAAVENIFKMLHNLMNRVSKASVIKAIGIALPGTIAKFSNKYYFEHPYQGVFPVNLQEQIEQRFGIETRIFQDPDCLLAAELSAMETQDLITNILALRWSHGIGMSILLNGKLYPGTCGLSGEIGHMVVDPDGPVCSCGKNGCLEIYSSVRAVLRQIKPSSGNDNLTDFNEALHLLQAGDLETEVAILKAIRCMSTQLANAINLMDPQLVIIGGEFSGLPEKYFDLFREYTMKYVMRGSEVRIVPSVLNNNAAALGATLLLMDKMYYEQFDSVLALSE
jgi:predicted NBD/HSP70 family sugar kinase